MNGATVANALFVGSIVLYGISMMVSAIDFAFSSTKLNKSSPPKTLVAVGSGGLDSVPSDDNNQPSPVVKAPVDPKTAKAAGRIGIVLTVIATLALTISIIVRISSTGRLPWGNMFEYIVGISAVGMVTWLFLMQRGVIPRQLNVFATFLVTMGLGISVRVFVEAGPLVPALESPWIAIHVSALILATGILSVGFIYAILHLLKRRYDKAMSDGKDVRFPVNLAGRLPNVVTLERLTFRTHVFAFPILTFGIFAGAVWAFFAWGRYWAWDPKEVWAFITWTVYAAYLHARVSGKTLRAWAPWIAIIGFIVMMFNLTAVNLVFPGLHSYSGV